MKIMNKILSVMSLVLVLTSYTSAFAGEILVPESAEIIALLKLKDTDMYEGKIDAPIQMVEYASMTCGHCAKFHNDYYYEIKEKFIDTGKVRFIFRELPWDTRALAVSMVARCAPKGEYFNFVAAFLSTRDTWAQNDDFLSSIKQIARLGGMAPKDVDACMKNEAVNDIVRKSYAEAVGPMKVKGTPTFFINGQRVEGAMSTEALADIITRIEASNPK